jgi:hypothetical protein
MMTAFVAMLGDVTAVNASRRQINGLIAWQDTTRQTDTMAREQDAGGACLDVDYAGSTLYRPWQVSCELILQALALQENQARRRAIEADAEAGAQMELAMQAAAAAAAARERAAGARGAAAACLRPEDAQAFLDEAAEAEADAAAADEAAAEHEAAAAAARARATALRAWEIAARDASGTGRQVLEAEVPVALAIGTALRQAGIAVAPRNKGYLQDGRRMSAGGLS